MTLTEVLSAGGYRVERGELNLARFVPSALNARLMEALLSAGAHPDPGITGFSDEEQTTLAVFMRRAVVHALPSGEEPWAGRPGRRTRGRRCS